MQQLFFLLFLICFFIPIKECDISPSNIECPQYTTTDSVSSNQPDTEEIENINESNESTVTNQLNSVQFEDSERSDTISFTLLIGNIIIFSYLFSLLFY